MNKTLWQRLTPHAIAIGIFFVISCLYCLPAFKGLVVVQADLIGWKGMAQQSLEFKEKYGYYPLWTKSLFSGMPAFQIAVGPAFNITLAYLHHLFTLFLPEPAGYFFLGCIGFYILSMVLGLKNWVAIFGAIGYAFSTYNAILVEVGHTTKLTSMCYAPAVLAGLILLTQRKYVIGFITTLVFSTLLAFQNHVQIVYYTLIIAVCLGIAHAIPAIRQKQYRHLGIAFGLALIAGLMGIASFALILLPTADYANETMRGGRSELTHVVNSEKSAGNKSKGGLDKDYAFSWSYGIAETMTVILPRYNGGSSGPSELNQEGKAVEALQEAQLPSEYVNYFFGSLSAYWGPQPQGTSGPVYFGVFVCLLFIAGLFVVRSWHLNWLVAATAVGIILAWGNHFKAINYFLFDYLPFYNKFRAPSMAMVIPQLTFCVLGSLALQSILYTEWDKKELMKRLKYALITTGVVAAILVLTYVSSDFKNDNDARSREMISSSLTQAMSQGKQPTPEILQRTNQMSSAIIGGLVQDRRSIYSGDLLRTLLFLAIGIVLVWLAVNRKVKAQYIAIAFAAFNVIDLLPVDSRYLNKDKYLEPENIETALAPNSADLQIKQDTSYFRVFDQTAPEGPSNSSRAAYHHNDVGGYHPAKLALYDDIFKNQLSKGNMRVYSMLNTKYFIVNNPATNQPVAQLNPEALGPAWLVKTIKYVDNADQEMKALDDFNPKDTVIIDKREQSKVTFPPQFDSTASIRFLQNLNDKITYDFNAASNQFAVFSEVYYPRGWKAFIDGKETPIVKVNYVLRGLPVPSGKHSIEFRFEPASYTRGLVISRTAGILSFIFVFAGLWWEWRKLQKKRNTSTA